MRYITINIYFSYLLSNFYFYHSYFRNFNFSNNTDGQNSHGNSPEKNDEKKNGFGAISVFLSDSVRHFKNIQNTYNTGHISTNFSNDNFSNDNEKSNNSQNDNNDNKNLNMNNAEISNNNNINKIKDFDNNNNNNNNINNDNNDDNMNFRKNGIGALNNPGVRGSPKGTKDWILAANKDIDEIWILNEIKNNSDSKYKNENIYATCFSTSTSSTTSTSTSSPPCVANFKVKVLLRTRADGPTKVSHNIFGINVHYFVFCFLCCTV